MNEWDAIAALRMSPVEINSIESRLLANGLDRVVFVSAR